MCNLSNTTKFIEKSKLIHGERYDYSLVDYKNKVTKVKIICAEHGEFEQRPDSHLIGSGCKKCSGKFVSCTESFINKSNKIHNYKFDYSLVNYTNSKNKLTIICPIHGEFQSSPNNHLSGSDCPNCNGNLVLQLDSNGFIQKAKEIHGDKYEYFMVDYKNFKTKVKIKCDKHGVFEQTPFNHVTNKHGCPFCKESHGEREIRKYLDEYKIKYKPQHKFDDCKFKYKLPFDFYLPDYNTCIEYDGLQHFKPVNKWGGEDAFILQQKRDEVKSEYCINKKITLIRINSISKIKVILKTLVKN